MSFPAGLNKKSYSEGLKLGYPPLAKNVLCIDFDGVLYSWGSDTIKKNAKEVMLDLKNRGYTLVIFTSRLSPRWIADERTSYKTQYREIVRLLERDNVPYDEITAEKIPALVYVDDRAIRFENNWLEISERIRDVAGA